MEQYTRYCHEKTSSLWLSAGRSANREGNSRGEISGGNVHQVIFGCVCFIIISKYSVLYPKQDWRALSVEFTDWKVHKQAHISLCAYCAYCAYVYSLFLLPFLFVVFLYVCIFFFFFFVLLPFWWIKMYINDTLVLYACRMNVQQRYIGNYMFTYLNSLIL